MQRESDITGDENAKEKYYCKLTALEAKFAFFNSQNLDEMTAGDADEFDDGACLNFDELRIERHPDARELSDVCVDCRL